MFKNKFSPHSAVSHVKCLPQNFIEVLPLGLSVCQNSTQDPCDAICERTHVLMMRPQSCQHLTLEEKVKPGLT